METQRFTWTRNAPTPGGFTLLEILIGTVLIGILVLGLSGIWSLVHDQFFRVTLRQKAIFVLHGHMERLSALYRHGIPIPTNNSSKNYTHHTWLSEDNPGTIPHIVFGLTLGEADFTTLQLTVTDLAQFTPGTIYLLDRGITGDSDEDRNVVWLDEEQRITAQISWTLEDASVHACYGGLSPCQILTLFLDYPYRYPEEATDPLETMWPQPETITLKTIVGERSFQSIVTEPAL
ncbi:MAG: type II secretion system GspH family protein [Magnetococcus sp. THC-1_WYH]